MMSIYMKIKTTADKLLKKYGEEPLTLTFITKGTYNPATGEVPTSSTTASVYGVITVDLVGQEEDQTFKREQPVAIIQVPTSYLRFPVPGDMITDSEGSVFIIEKFQNVKPGATAVVWKLWLKG